MVGLGILAGCVEVRTMGKAARAMKRRAGEEDRKAMVKRARQERRAAAQAGRMVRGPGGPRLMRQPQASQPRKVSFASLRDRVLADGSVVVGPDGEQRPLFEEPGVAASKPTLDARNTRTGRFIEGRDYPAKEGSKVRAVADGVVDEVGKTSDEGGR
jgi:murein DD-endopeptidase MepM/ murein hydrolase activator NlpD